MSFLSFFMGQKKNTANVAKERLQIILARERGLDDSPDFLPKLQQELLDVIAKYVKINREDVKVSLERQDSLEVLDIKIEIPPKVKEETA